MRKPPLPIFDPDTEEGQANLDALGAYIQANGGGPTRPEASWRGAAWRRPGARRRAVPPQLRLVPQLHRPRRRAVVGQVRPAARPGQRDQIYTAMLTGPQNMPKFSDRQLTPEEKEDIIAYVKSVSGQATASAATTRAESARRPRASSPSSSAGGDGRDCDLAGERRHEPRPDPTVDPVPASTATAAAAAPDRDAAPAAGDRRPTSRPCRRSSWPGSRRTSTTSRSCTTRTRGRSRAPAPRSALRDPSRCGSSSRRCAAWRSWWRSWLGRTSTALPATPATSMYALYTPLIGALLGWPSSRWASR
jgi:hypothetical protein